LRGALLASGAEDPSHDPRCISGLEQKRQDEKRRSMLRLHCGSSFVQKGFETPIFGDAPS
jgi:hypothetical protein